MLGGALTEAGGGPSENGGQGTGAFATSSVAMMLMAKMGHVEGQVRMLSLEHCAEEFSFPFRSAVMF